MALGLLLRHWRIPNLSLVNYLLRDEFSIAESAPLTSPRTAKPGPGTGTIVDSTNSWDIAGGAITPNAASSGVSADPHIVYGGLARSSGLALLIRAKYDTSVGGTDNTSFVAGFSSSASSLGDGNFTGFLGNYASSDALNGTYSGSGGATELLDNMPDNTYKKLYVVLRSAGAFLIVETKLAYVYDAVTTTPMYPAIASVAINRVPYHTDYFRSAQLGIPWDSDYGIATARFAGSVSQGQTFTHEADCLIEYTMTTLSTAGDNTKLFFRVQDANNYWYAYTDSLGAFSLYEVVAGTPALRALASAGTISSGDRLLVAVEDETIKGYVADSLKWTYSSAANFKTETSGEMERVGNATISDLVVWPRQLSGITLSKLGAI